MFSNSGHISPPYKEMFFYHATVQQSLPNSLGKQIGCPCIIKAAGKNRHSITLAYSRTFFQLSTTIVTRKVFQLSAQHLIRILFAFMMFSKSCSSYSIVMHRNLCWSLCNVKCLLLFFDCIQN